MWRLPTLAALTLCVFSVTAVDHSNFKTCDKSGFCKRLRNYKPEQSPFELLLDTVKADGESIRAEVINHEAKEARFVFQLTALEDNTFRVYLDEKEPLYPRYKVQLALDGEPKISGFKITSKMDGKLISKSIAGHKVIITAKPLSIEFFDENGESAVVINGRGLMAIEHLRSKPEEGSDGAARLDEEQQLGMWEENFKSHHDSKLRGPEALAFDVTFPGASQVYGIPEHADKFALRTTTSGDPYRLYNLDVFEYEMDSTMAIYGSIPVLYAHGSSRTVGVFWHNSAETWVEIENSNDANVVSSLVNLVTGSGAQKTKVDAKFISESGVFDAFVFMGPNPSDVTRQYTALTGVATLPPQFSLAYHQSRWNYVDMDDVRQLDENFDLHDIPADVVWLDIEYTDKKKYFTWDQYKFAHPAEMVANLTAKGRKLVVIIDPHIKREAGYFLHEDALENGYYVKNDKGEDYDGWCWPGSSGYLDFFDPRVTEYYASRYSYDNFPGTSKHVHLWNDMNEPSVFNGPEITMPKDNRHYKPASEASEGISSYWEHRHVHNEYGLSHVAATYRGLLDRDEGKYRPFILSRANFAGTQRYAAVWTGDNMAEWSHLAATVPMCLSLSIAGISFCGADVGGFFKYPDAEMMTRWYQAGAMQPFFRAHSHIETKRREPWLYDESTMKLIREAVRGRYSLIDFWYTLFYEHTLNGEPVMRPIWYHFPKEAESYAIDYEYMLGDKLLVRPVTEPGVRSVNVYFPGHSDNVRWYDINTYTPEASWGSVSKEVNIERIPVYQRGGTIIPKKERVRRASTLMKDDPYTLVVALDKNNKAEGTIFIDDGETFDYKKGKFIYGKITYNGSTLEYSFDSKSSYPTKEWLERVVIAGVGKPPKTAKATTKDGKSTALQMTYHKGNSVLVIRKPALSFATPWKIVFTF